MARKFQLSTQVGASTYSQPAIDINSQQSIQKEKPRLKTSKDNSDPPTQASSASPLPTSSFMASSLSSPAVHQNRKQIPASLAKYFKTTIKAQKLMDPEDRICELDRNSHESELVYSRHPSHSGIHGMAWDQMSWSQARLWEQSQKGTIWILNSLCVFTVHDRPLSKEPQLMCCHVDPTLRVSRKNVRALNLKAGDVFEISITDVFNEREQRAHAGTDDVVYGSITLGFEQCKRGWVYILSQKVGKK
jgi:hypothetical protein